ncbi:MAG TPA: hypothetical protein VMU66_10205 [Gaiellales bacterium]|nr:hypothetical protein [Gaiellales bacterium]
MSALYERVPHPHMRRRPRSTREHALEAAAGRLATRMNTRIALQVTAIVGTMWCAYAFACIALVGLPPALGFTFIPSRASELVLWVSSEFIQLVLLAVIMVGQGVQATASDRRAVDTYNDAEAVLHEALQIQQHLVAQDAVLSQLIERLQPAGAAPARPPDAPPGAGGR